eukprot:m.39105 g.39105  ORF g.39105 m.39105 type:complete len:1369 (+) comp6841_c0_seq1:103-4209(+)
MGVVGVLTRVLREVTTTVDPLATTVVAAENGGACSAELESAGIIVFIFFGLALGVCTRQFINALRIPIPYTVCLLLLGLVWGAITNATDFGHLGNASCIVSSIDPSLLLLIFLPLLVFESAFSLNYHAFRDVLIPSLILAVPGLLMGIFVTGAIIHEVVLPGEFDWNSSFLLGTILSATDPVAVVALLKELGGPPGLATLIESESLLNDGTAIVAYEIFLELAAGVHITGAEGVEKALRLSLGGPALGLLWGVISIFWIGRIIDDDLSEVSITLLSAYLLFFVAEDVCGVSAVLALVVLGACFAAYGKTRISPNSLHSTHTFWRMLTYHGNTLIFVFVGIVLVLNNDFETISGRDWGMVIVLWLFLYLIRGAMMLVFALPLRWSGYNLTWKDGFVATHGGLRGAVSLSLAIAVSLGGGITGQGTGLADVVQSKTLFYVGGCAFLTLIVNASTTSLLLRKLGLVKELAAQKAVYDSTRSTINNATKRALANMSHDTIFSLANWDEINNFLSLPDDDSALDFETGMYQISEQMNEEMDDKMREDINGVLNDLHNNDLEFTDKANKDQQKQNEKQLQDLFHGDAEKPLGRLRSIKYDANSRKSSSSTEFGVDPESFIDEDEEDQGLVLELEQERLSVELQGNRRGSYLSEEYSEGKIGKRAFSVRYGSKKEMDAFMPAKGIREHLLHKKVQRRASKFSSAQLHNSRLRLISSTRAIYWELFESGFLSREVVQVLVLSSESEEERIKDDSLSPLKDWSAALKQFVSRPWYLRLLQYTNWFCFDLLRKKLERYFIIRHAADVVNLCDAFIAAHRKTLADLSGAIAEVSQNKMNVSTLVNEATVSMNEAKLVLRALPDAVVSAVRSKQAAALLVSKQEFFINEKLKRGVITAIECDHLLKHIHQLRGKLVLHAPQFSFPTPACVLKWSRLFDNLSPEAMVETTKSIQTITRKRGDVLIRAGDPVDGLYILLRGFVSLFVPTFDRKVPPKHDLGNISHTYLTAGSLLAAIEMVSGAQGVVSVIVTSSNAQFAFIPKERCIELLEKHNSFKRNMYRISAYHLLFQKRHKAFTVAGRVFPPARNIAHAPFGIQEELWPFAKSGAMEKMSPGQHIVIGVAGIVVKGVFLGIKDTQLQKSSVHHVASHVFSPNDGDDDDMEENHRNSSVDSEPSLSLKRGGLPTFRMANTNNPSIMQADHLSIPIASDECNQVADVSETISSAITARHMSRPIGSVSKRSVRFDSKVYKPFSVIKCGEYICREEGLIFVIGPTTVQNTDVFEVGDEEEEEETEGEDGSEHDAHSDSETDGEVDSRAPTPQPERNQEIEPPTSNNETPVVVTKAEDGIEKKPPRLIISFTSDGDVTRKADNSMDETYFEV